MSTQQCTIEQSYLLLSPYSLVLGDSIFINVVATNVKGDSLISEDGNGATIIQPPDSPVNLAEDVLLRSASTLGLTWNAGA